MTYINSNLTNREAYALHGKLDDARMQELLDLEDKVEELEDKVEELEGVINDLIDNNERDLLKIVENLK